MAAFRLSILILCLCSFTAYAEFPASFDAFNYSEADKHALSYRGKDFGSVSKLADSLTRPFTNDNEKARAIYRWITDNIRYDCKAYHDPLKRTDDYEEVLKKRKAVCSGYASLYKVLCDFAGLDCEIVNGYARFSYQRIGEERIEDNHAWNAVKIDGKWQLVDVTWGSGYTDERVRKFTKKYSEQYFLTDPRQFVLTHFPADKKWQLLDRPVSKRKFRSFPFVYEGYYKNKVVAFAPRKGTIHTDSGRDVHFKFKTGEKTKITSASVITDSMKKPEEVKVKHTRKGISFHYTFPKQGEYYINLALNSEYTIVYKVVAK